MALEETTASQAKALSRIERKRNQKMRDILMVAAEVLNRDGYHSMDLDEVGEKMDLTRATLYHYFSSKDALVAACLSLVGNEVNDRLQQLADETAANPPLERLRDLVTEQLTILLIDYPQASRPFYQPGDWPTEHRELIRSLRARHDKIFRDIVMAGTESGDFHGDPNVALHCLYGAINYAPLWVRPGSPSNVRRAIESIREIVLKMLI
jgi:AcrR family transcriptional regulator